MQHRYVELHLHTAYSFLDGASLPDEMIACAKELGYAALAVTDHDGLYGAMEFAKAAAGAEIFAIPGAELTLTDESHLTLLAENRTGYTNLCKLITEAHRLPPGAPIQRLTFSADDEDGGLDLSLRGIGKPQAYYRPEDRIPRFDPELLASHSEGIILLTGCRQGRLSQLVDAGDRSAARALLEQYIAWMGRDSVFVELQHNKVYGDVPRIRQLVRLADEAGVGYVATGNVHYHIPDRHRLQDVLVAIRHRTTLDNSHQLRRPNSEFYLRSAEEMAQLFAEWPAAISNTIAIADRCRAFDLANDLSYVFPDYSAPDGTNPDTYLRKVCYEELAVRYSGDKTEAIKRLEEELQIIGKHKLAGFFLLYRDLLVLAADIALEVRGRKSPRTIANLPPGRGRGSSVSSIVCYLFGLSHVDPIAHNLFFGRFLNAELNSIPDIDLDFPREIRERLIERVYEEYGHDHVGLVCAFATYRLRSAVRDVGKALGLPLPELDKIAKLSEPRSAKELGSELDRIPGYAKRKNSPPWCYLIELAEQLSHFPRHITQHVGGMIISSQPLTELMPLQPAAMQGRVLCQWDKDSCEDVRAVKIDFLALGMLSLVEECLELIAKAGKKPIDLSRIDFEDKAIYDMIGAGDTIGVFQIESRAQIQMLPRTRPTELNHLVVQVAIVRPGPIIGGAVKPYVAYRQEEQEREQKEERTCHLPIEPQYDHDDLRPVLADTHGVILYQEQVVQVAMVLAGFTAGQADDLRRAMTRKRSEEAMAKLWVDFRDGAKARGVTIETARTVFKKLRGFASYGFPKAHAVAFAILAYQSCWLKLYYPAEFLCALLNNQPMGFYPNHVLINDAKRTRWLNGKKYSLLILEPDIELSSLRCTVERVGEKEAIRVGIGYVKGMSEETARHVVLERIAHGPYRSLADFIRRVPLSLEAIENLIMVGAFDRFNLGKRESLWLAGLFIPSRKVGVSKKAESGRQLALPLPVEQDQVELRPMGPWEQMAADYAIIGMSPRYHPFGLLRGRLPKHLVRSTDLENLRSGSTIELAGLVVCRQRPGTAKGITFLLLEDEVGLVNVIVSVKLYEKERITVRTEPFLIVKGELQIQQGVINIIAQGLTVLDGARASFHAPEPKSMEDIFDTPSMAPQKLEPVSHNYR